MNDENTNRCRLVNDPGAAVRKSPYIVNNSTKRLTMQAYIVNNPTEKLTMQAYIVNNPTKKLTMQAYIVDNSSGGMTMKGGFVVVPVVETINQRGFIAILPVGRSKPHHFKTNPNKKSMIS